MNSHSWHDDAACKDSDPDLFYPEQWSITAAAVALNICSGCPVKQPCLTEALEQGDDWGIRGQTTGSQRRTIRRRQAQRRHPATLPEFRTVL